MPCSSARGQTEPLAALVAVTAVAVGLSLYAGVLDDAFGDRPQRAIAEPTLDRVEHDIVADGVVRPSTLAEGLSAGPVGYDLNLTLTTGRRRWSAGPSSPNGTDRAQRRVSVRVGPADVRPGTLRAEVW